MSSRKHEGRMETASVGEMDSVKEINERADKISSCEACSETYSNSKVYQNSANKLCNKDCSNCKNESKDNKTVYRIEDYPIEDIENSMKDSMKNPRKINQAIIKNIMKLIEDAELDIGFDFEYRNQYNDNKLYITLDYRDYFGEVDY